ncbi:MAG: acyl carrier protein [Verrucomicrobiota bacterium]|jgi:acyl carrier protein
MDKPEFYQRLAEILDVEEVKPEDVLKEFDGWDSLAILSVLAMADAKYGVSIKAEEIRSVVSAQNLANLVEAKHKPE